MNYYRLLKTGITLFSFLIFPLIAESADFSGVVYADLNKNNKRIRVKKESKEFPFQTD